MADVPKFPYPQSWDRVGFKTLGFDGFVPFIELRDSSPAKGGLYDVADLADHWVDDSPVLYIGKADPVGGIHKRVKQFARRGSSHTGGRSIWQLQDADDLIVAWAATPGELGAEVETRWIARYRELFGKRPFANRRD